MKKAGKAKEEALKAENQESAVWEAPEIRGLKQIFAMAMEKIALSGHSVIHANARRKGSAPGSPMASVSHTMGLWDKNLPEIILCGQEAEVAQEALNQAVGLLKSGKIEAGSIVEGLGVGKGVFKKADRAKALRACGLLDRLAEAGAAGDALIWALADEEGHWPWEEACDQEVKELPQLWETLH